LRRRKIRTSPRELGAALAVALALGGCGSGAQRAAPPPPHLPAALASQLASRSDEVARLLSRNDACGALAAATDLQRKTVAAINSGRVPARLQEPLQSAANDLVFRIRCVPPPAPDEDDKGKNEGHGKGHDGGDD
jgi:hypothetical protein